ncbi:UTRA domain-containing protein [Paracoccus sp. JM45]|uniref:UTRA domain-containing protein n=1 Tax=Paracoccus sp. JM45 TaxID=2283626 RepID=UPI002107E331|nr:UTRA domain-containing protein [Paracoccus sp. JM45]
MRDEIENLGTRYSYALCAYETGPGIDSAREALQVDLGHPLLMVKSRYLSDNNVYCCEAIWLNPAVIDLPDPSVFETEPPQEWLSGNLPVQQTRFAILAREIEDICASNLNLLPGTPVLTIERVNSLDAVPVSFARQFYPPHHRLIFDD